MALQKREKLLAGATGAILVTFAGVFLFRGGGESLSDLRNTRKRLQATVDAQEAQARPGVKARQELNQWRKRSLPTDPNLALNKYNGWLGQLAVQRLGQVTITPMTPELHGGVYTTLPFRIEGQGTWDQLTRFLFDFYSAGYLHKVRLWNVNPIAGSANLDLSITVEAVCLPGAVEQKDLPKDLATYLDHAEVDEYLKTIVRRRLDQDPEKDRFDETRGLFAFYAPPRPPDPPDTPKPEPPKFDASEHTYVNAIHEVNGLPEVWLFVRTEGRTLELHEGDPFEVGLMSGTIARIRIDDLDVEIEVEGEHQLVAFGDSLRQGKQVPR